ncbi:MAG: CocE/NonD family hydrolase [Acidobacteria bacterium]|nr:CocE/NonD family hydrolase [Acidobacteriota bacterium]
MKRNQLYVFFTLLALCFTLPLRAADQFPVLYERNAAVKMRDGVTLRADIYRPQTDGKFPVLLERTPYDKNAGFDFGLKAAARGYVVIIQDVRGRYSSEGDWYTFKNEPSDGYDTIEWAAALPYANGKVGMFGGSYVGATQMLAAIAHPPHLAGICPVVTASNYHNGWTYQGGAFEQWFNESWTSGLVQNTLGRWVAKNTNALNGIWKLPLPEYPLLTLPGSSDTELTLTLAPYFRDWLEHPSYDAYWKEISIEEHFSDIAVPALHVAAWYDIFLGGSLRNYLGIKQHGASEAARQGQQLMVTIGGHSGRGPKVGDVDFGPAAEEKQDDVALRWYDYLFKGVQNDFASTKKVKIFVLGANQWREEEDWPLARAESVKYYLHSAAKANSLRGNGTLSTAAPGKEGPDQYVYDPANPAPTVGGPLCCDPLHWPAGPRDQRSVESRDDVLVYSTAPLSEDTEVTGPLRLELYAKSSAVDTDFTGKLVDVWPEGFAQNLSEGLVRARYRASQEKPELLTPGEIYQFSIDLWATSNVFKKGHRIRPEVSSSNFPRFDRNLNMGNTRYIRTSDTKLQEQFVSATNLIYHDSEHPSALVLPLVRSR